MKRGEVYYVDLLSSSGSEQGGCRPCVVIQNDDGNRFSGTTIIAPMTSQTKKRLPTHVPVSPKDRVHPSTIILLEQIRAVDKQRIGNYICRLCTETMENVDRAIGISLALHKEERSEKPMNELKIFENEEFGEIRISTKDGEPMFCLSDICKALELTQPSKVKERLSEKGVNTIPTLTKGGMQNLLYINEANLYRAIFQSRKESAEHFTDWITEEVIPSIRKTGGYQQKKMTPEEMMRVQLGMIDDHESRIENLENNMTIDYGSQRVLANTVNKTVIDVLGGKQSNAYKEVSNKVFAECNRDLKNHFNVNSRNDVPKKRFDEALEYAKSWRPCMNTILMIRDCNAQISI